MTPTSLAKDLYRRMVRIRRVEETIAELYAEQQMRCPVHLSIGQESVAVAAGAAVRQTDYAMSGHRSHAHYLAKGGNLRAMFAEMYGRETGCCSGRGGSMHLIDLDAGFLGAVPIVGSTIPIAVGTAFAIQRRKEDRVTLTFFGEGATEEGVFHESMNFASLHKLPIVFVCENNLYSVYSPMRVRQPAHREVFHQAQGHGVSALQADGNDLLGAHALMTEAVAKARAGQGPIFIEFLTYRWREHCGPGYDNHIGYRTEAEYLAWKEKCPVARMEREYGTAILLTTEEEAALRNEIEDAVAFAKASPFPNPETIARHLYAAPIPFH
ncbi:pyruvate dehydrogenase E1 component alpha subunit [Verrucomicrobium sp. GAS474]|uniref:thiamine pyrophosphate-dependent dehydrogenase E1 component subunit alpha n=1 Tax=Verrucomicrobium sp. GAS474 TaxID=1882831 RepID=UPI00087BA229|nr:thiamine pyrophosphate-dependent dehydrogenase E1 component subunit alpha [Verrucomicrobium sp. GAS474]SDT94737.1 pyruvate dehydrogenase E1 component alpha subunit [Verrucomicrobium sp. GAS474]